jgi:hypothetical protein
MLERTDRVCLAVRDAAKAAEDFATIFATEIVDISPDSVAGAMRTTLQWGQDQVELFEPNGAGPTADFLGAGRSGLFAGGFTSQDPQAAAAILQDSGIRVEEQPGDRFVILPGELDGTGVVLSKTQQRDRVGLNDKIWQITYAVPDLASAVTNYSALFNLEDTFTNYYTSEHFGYEGAITWFDARDGGLLDSLEYLEPNDENKNVARFVERNGNGIYMASIESDDIPAIKERVTATGDGWQGTDFGGFIHPKRLHGLLLGLVSYESWNARRPLPD